MMYGFGDAEAPLPESTALMEDLVVDHLQQLLGRALAAGEERQRNVKRPAGGEIKIKERDLLFALRKDRRRHARVVELLEVWREQKAATKTRNPEDYDKDDDDDELL